MKVAVVTDSTSDIHGSLEAELGVTWHDSAEHMVGVCDVVTINAPLHPETENLFDHEMIGRMKRGVPSRMAE